MTCTDSAAHGPERWKRQERAPPREAEPFLGASLGHCPSFGRNRVSGPIVGAYAVVWEQPQGNETLLESGNRVYVRYILPYRARKRRTDTLVVGLDRRLLHFISEA